MSLIKIVVLVVLLGGGQTAFALKSDADQPVHIDSNTATYNDNTGNSIYIGNVVTVQGSLRITSNKLVVYVTDGEIDKMVFTGKPAKFKQLPSKGKDYIYGEGLTGEYYPSQNRLILIEQAVVSQGNNRSASKIITYDSKNYLIQAGKKSSGASRVHSVFQPKVKKQDAE